MNSELIQNVSKFALKHETTALIAWLAWLGHDLLKTYMTLTL